MCETEQVPVLVVGAGPVGLTTALLLARRGVRPLVVDRHPGTSVHPRARGISGAAMEVFTRAGVAEKVRAAGEVLAKNVRLLTVDTLAGTELDRTPMTSVLDAQRSGDMTAGFTLCPQDRLEPVLREEVERAGGRVLFGTRLNGFDDDGTGIGAWLTRRTTGDELRVRAAYLVGADGTRSTVRSCAGIGADGPGVLGRHVNVHFRADLTGLVAGREFLFCFTKTPRAPGILAPVDNAGRWQFNVTLTEHDTEADFTRERCVALVRAAVGVADLEVDVERILSWGPGLRIAETFQRGRVVLAGDAAHELPAGGLGVGVEDAAELAPRLADAVSDPDSGRLAGYTSTRRPAVRETADHIVAQTGPSGLPT